jgi:hypothetical protein
MTDLAEVMPLLEKVYAKSQFSECSFSEALTTRAFMTSVGFDQGFAKVCVVNERIVGFLAGLSYDNQWGAKCAHDIFMYSDQGTHRLIKEFYSWATSQGAEFVQISDFSGAERYHKLLGILGFKKSGTIFIGGL